MFCWEILRFLNGSHGKQCHSLTFTPSVIDGMHRAEIMSERVADKSDEERRAIIVDTEQPLARTHVFAIIVDQTQISVSVLAAALNEASHASIQTDIGGDMRLLKTMWDEYRAWQDTQVKNKPSPANAATYWCEKLKRPPAARRSSNGKTETYAGQVHTHIL